jgi:hypothetical protein
MSETVLIPMPRAEALERLQELLHKEAALEREVITARLDLRLDALVFAGSPEDRAVLGRRRTAAIGRLITKRQEIDALCGVLGLNRAHAERVEAPAAKSRHFSAGFETSAALTRIDAGYHRAMAAQAAAVDAELAMIHARREVYP